MPWAELARRIEGVEGQVDFQIAIDFGTQADTVSPYVAPNDNACVFHAGRILGMFLHDDQVHIERKNDMGVRASLPLPLDSAQWSRSLQVEMSRWLYRH